MKQVPVVVALAAALSSVAPFAWAQAHRESAAREATVRNPSDANASLALGRVLRRAGAYDAALAELRRGSMLPAARAVPISTRMRREIALAYLDQGKFQPAMTACRQLLGLQGAEALAHVCIAETHMLHKRATEALPEIAKAQALSPALYEAKVVEGYARWQEGSTSQAEAAFRSAGAADSSRPEAWLGLGRFLLANTRKTEALDAFEKAVSADSEGPDALYALASGLPATERSATLLRQAVTGRPSFGAAHARLAEVLFGLSRLQDAEQEARASLQCPGVESDWHVILGEIQLRRGQAADALQAAQAALKLVANNARAKLLLADAHAARHDIDLAIEAWQASFNLAHTNPTPLVHGALGCLANQRETTAKAFADRATQGFPQHAPAWDAAGDVAAKAGDKTAARAAWTKAIAATDGTVVRDAIRRKIATLKE